MVSNGFLEFGRSKRYNSKKYETRAEAKDGELEYLNKIKANYNVPIKMTIGDLWNSFLEYQENKVRLSTKIGYKYRCKYLNHLFEINVLTLILTILKNGKSLLIANSILKMFLKMIY